MAQNITHCSNPVRYSDVFLLDYGFQYFHQLVLSFGTRSSCSWPFGKHFNIQLLEKISQIRLCESCFKNSVFIDRNDFKFLLHLVLD